MARRRRHVSSASPAVSMHARATNGLASGFKVTGCRRAGAGIIFTSLLLVGMGCGVGTHAANLPPQAERGKQIYFEGTSPGDKPITALVGADAIALPAQAVPCANCHGDDGRGRPEGGVLPTDITWGHLVKSYGHHHSYGRHHPAFNEATAAVAITQGLDPAGNPLDLAMPRYRMAEGDLDALVAYLKRLDSDIDPGLSPGSIRLATLLPLSGHLASLGDAMHAIMTAYIQNLNASGGLHGRRIELEVIPYGDSPREALANVQQAIRETEIFALVGGYSVGLEVELARLLEEEHLPLVGPFTLQPHVEQGFDRYTFYLYPGLEQMSRVLVDYAASALHEEGSSAVIGPATPLVRRLNAVVVEQTRTHGWETPQNFHYPAGLLDPAKLAADLHLAGSEILFFFGAADELDALLGELARSGTLPKVFLPATVMSPLLFDAPTVFDGRIFITYPTLPGDVSPIGREGYVALKQKYELPTEHLSGQIAAYAAIKILAEGLKSTGQKLSRERLISSLEGLYQFETGLMPPITYTFNRRIGAHGAHVVKLDLRSRRYTPVGEWMTLK
jgi:ABC-type branched-subunit amino acid transport system substrate-binding protein